jgi:hypothetical protein
MVQQINFHLPLYQALLKPFQSAFLDMAPAVRLCFCSITLLSQMNSRPGFEGLYFQPLLINSPVPFFQLVLIVAS